MRFPYNAGALIYERRAADGSRVFEVGWRDQDRHQHWRTIEGGIMAARAERDRILGDRANGRSVAEPKLTFGKAAKSWLAKLEQLDRDERTVAERRRHVERLSGWHTRRLDEITADDLVRKLADLREQGLSGRSQALVLNTIKRVYRHAERNHWRGTNPVDTLEADERPEHQPAPHVVFADELDQVIEAAHEPYRTVFQVMRYTGCRISEALGLMWDDLYLDAEDPRIAFMLQLGANGERKRPKRGSRGKVGSRRSSPPSCALT